MTGAACGGALGALAGWSVSTHHILKYEEHLRAGKYLVIAHGSPAEMEHAHRIMHGTGAQDLHHHRDTGYNMLSEGGLAHQVPSTL